MIKLNHLFFFLLQASNKNIFNTAMCVLYGNLKFIWYKYKTCTQSYTGLIFVKRFKNVTVHFKQLMVMMLLKWRSSEVFLWERAETKKKHWFFQEWIKVNNHVEHTILNVSVWYSSCITVNNKSLQILGTKRILD